MAGRPRLFDETDALRAAIRVFWEHGYTRSSMAHIEAATGVGRQSLYNAIGSKEVIFTRALELYAEEAMAPVVAALHGPGTPLERIRAALTATRAGLADGECRGCLIVQTMSEIDDATTPLAALMRARIQMFEGLYHGVLAEAKRAGELADDVDTRALTRLIMTCTSGMALMARANVPESFLDDVLSAALVRLT